jgi:hypothetical protein
MRHNGDNALKLQENVEDSGSTTKSDGMGENQPSAHCAERKIRYLMAHNHWDDSEPLVLLLAHEDVLILFPHPARLDGCWRDD